MKKPELIRLSRRLATSTLTIAELASGSNTAGNVFEEVRRRRHLRLVEALTVVLPFDSACAHAYGLVAAAVERIGRKPGGSRAIDLMIAATAVAHRLPLCTANQKDFRGLEDLAEIVDVSA